MGKNKGICIIIIEFSDREYRDWLFTSYQLPTMRWCPVILVSLYLGFSCWFYSDWIKSFKVLQPTSLKVGPIQPTALKSGFEPYEYRVTFEMHFMVSQLV